MPKVEIDFIKDWQGEILKDIKDEGIQILKDIKVETLIIRYLTYLRKKGTGKPYNVYKSKEFNCPHKFKAGLNQIIHILKYGGDISPYLSKEVDKLENDGMFNDWGVLHLHLGKEMEKNNKYVKRTGPLLFLYFKESNAYLINIYNHGDWTKKEVLQTMYDNWPELIEPFILNGIKGLDPELSEKERLKLRKLGATTIIELKDKNGKSIICGPPGFGISSSGAAIIDAKDYLTCKTKIKDLEKTVKNNIVHIKNCIKLRVTTIPNTFIFTLIRKNNEWLIKENNTKLVFKLICK